MRRNPQKFYAYGQGAYCMTLNIDSIEEEERAGASLVELIDEDLMPHSACDE